MNKKAGRNELCPCGSGKKFKKCCALKPRFSIQQLSNTEQPEKATDLKRLFELSTGNFHFDARAQVSTETEPQEKKEEEESENP